ncbi:MAG: rRNA pseudouridine synthase [Verrucomicrobia bacterium]|nr:rRNA pseudouridine synthase [Verrucomicrobiota bacterium]
MKLVRYIANLGYGSRREVEHLVRSGQVTDDSGRPLGRGELPSHEVIRLHGEPLDPPFPLTILLHKPAGYTCSTEDPGATIYDLLPERFRLRNPGLHPAGRLDKESRGLVILTDDGALSHRIIRPKSSCAKIYRVTVARPLEGHERASFSSGGLMLHGESKPLLPAGFEKTGTHEALVILHEGRYHQVRRMFAAVGNHVTDLVRISIGGIPLPADLDEGRWRVITRRERDALGV